MQYLKNAIIFITAILFFSCNDDECGKTKAPLTANSFAALPIYNYVSPDRTNVFRVYIDSLNTVSDTINFALAVNPIPISRSVGKCTWCKCGGQTVHDQGSQATISMQRRGLSFGQINSSNQDNDPLDAFGGNINGLYCNVNKPLKSNMSLTYSTYYKYTMNTFQNIKLGNHTYNEVAVLSDSLGNSIYIHQNFGLVAYTTDHKKWFYK